MWVFVVFFFLNFQSIYAFISYSDESPLIPNEFLHEPHITAQDLGGEPILGLMLENEPDLWIQTVPSSVKRSFKEKQVTISFLINHMRFRLDHPLNTSI